VAKLTLPVHHHSTWYFSRVSVVDALRGEWVDEPPAFTTRLGDRRDTAASWVFKARLLGGEVVRQNDESWRPVPEAFVGSLVIADTITCNDRGEAYLTGQDVPERLAIGIGCQAAKRLEVVPYPAALKIPSGMTPDYPAIEGLFADPHPADVAAAMAAASQNHNASDHYALVN
jgi:hypothetical protein